MAQHPNEEQLKKAYQAFGSGDLDTVGQLLADDVLWHVGGDTPISGDYKGRDEVFGFFAKLVQETGGSFKLDVHDILANDEHAVALCHTSAQRNGKTLDQNVVHVYHIGTDGRATEFWGFPEDSRVIEEFWS